MLKNTLIIDNTLLFKRDGSYVDSLGRSLIQFMDVVIVVNEEDQTFEYVKERFIGLVGTFPLSHLEAHVEILKRMATGTMYR